MSDHERPNDGTTHAEGCHALGRQHYECALREIERLRHRIAGLIELQGRDSKELRALCEARDEARRDRTALRAMVDQQNAALNDAANEIERLLAVQCERDELRARIAAAPVGLWCEAMPAYVCLPSNWLGIVTKWTDGKRVRLVAEGEG